MLFNLYTQLIKLSYTSEANVIKPLLEQIYLYSFAPSDAKESIKEFGLASSKAIKDNPELLNNIFPEKSDQDSWLKEFDSNDISLKGISIFFSKPDMNKIIELDSDHFLAKEDYDLIQIDYNKLLEIYPDTKIMGLELIPYEDNEYDELKKQIEHWIEPNELLDLCDKDFNETWENYLVGAGYFAANVPHGIVINSDGLIPVECLKWV